jgi:hypothetical protein
VPVRRLLNASPDDVDVEVVVGGGLGIEFVIDAGVIGLEPGAELPAEESIAHTSCCPLFLGCKLVLLITEPSF